MVILKMGHRKMASGGDRDEGFGAGSDDGVGANAMILQRHRDPRWRLEIWMAIRGKRQPVAMVKEAQVRLWVLMLVLFGFVLGATFGGRVVVRTRC